MGRERIIFLSSPEETLEIGKRVALSLCPNSVLALTGDLGAGKTTFVQGMALGLGLEEPIQSPTFVYLNTYLKTLPLFHFDLYRMNTVEDFLSLGFEEYFEQGGICAIEWPDRIVSLLPERTLHLHISHHPEGRVLTLSGVFPEKLIESFPLCP